MPLYGPSLEHIQRALQADLDSIATYCVTWQLRMNAAKCTYSIFSLATGGAYWRLTLTLNGQIIPYTSHPCLLGVTLDRKLHLRTLIRTVCSTFDQRFYGRLSKMAGTNWGSSAGVLRTLYLSLVKTALDYSTPILPRALEDLYVRHRRAVRYIAGLTSRTSDVVAGVMCSIEPLELSLFRAMTLS